MESNEVVFSETDRVVINSYRYFLDGLADYLGDGFEYALHSLEDYNNSVIKIINGHYTGRKLGAPITDLALRILGEIQQDEEEVGHRSYQSKNKYGKQMFSTTICIYGEQHRVIGLVCINFYTDTALSMAFPFFKTMSAKSAEFMNENFAGDSNTLLEEFYHEAKDKVMADGTISGNLKNKEMIRILHQKGVFNIKDSVQKVADLMEISRNTVYLHLRSIREEDEA